MARCFFCNNIELNPNGISYSLSSPFSCKYCGNYEFIRDAKINCEKDYEFRAKGAAIAQEIKNQGNDGYILTYNRGVESRSNVDSIFRGNSPFLSYYPTNYSEVVDRVLKNIGQKTALSPLNSYRPNLYEFGLFFVTPNPTFYSEKCPLSVDLTDIKSKIQETVSLLCKRKYIEITQIIDRQDDFLPFSIKLTLDGLEHIQKNQQNTSQSNNIFLAMWFGDNSLLEKYTNTVSNAAIMAGYNKPYKADKKPYNGHIMNEIIDSISISRFLIADLTCEFEKVFPDEIEKNGVRGGVYYEAGFAKGRGIEVILTCHKDCKKNKLVHFDLEQYKMILWEEKDDGVLYVSGTNNTLENAMKDWIIESIGAGSNKNAT